MSRFTDAGQYMYHRFNSPLPSRPPHQGHHHQQPGRQDHRAGEEVAGRPAQGAEPALRLGLRRPLHGPDRARPAGSPRSPAVPEDRADRRPAVQDERLPPGGAGAVRHRRGEHSTSPPRRSAPRAATTSASRWSSRAPPTAPLSVAVTGKDVVVSLATDAAGARHQHGRAGRRRDQRQRRRPRRCVTARDLPRQRGRRRRRRRRRRRKLTDFLNAPASVSRAAVPDAGAAHRQARDGSKVGVFLYCQQHAREWVTPLTCVETAERLVRNYAHRPADQEAAGQPRHLHHRRRSTPTARTTRCTTATRSART